MVAVLALAAAHAQQVHLAAEPTKLGLGQSGTARVTIQSAMRRGPQPATRPPTLDPPEGVGATYVGQSQQYSNRNGVLTQINQFEYRLTALRLGEWDVGPVDVAFSDGSTLQTGSVTLTVVPRNALQRSKFDVSATFSHDEVWEGQILLYEFRLRSTVDVVAVEWNHPRFDGVRQTQQGQPKGNRYLVDDPEGRIIIEEGVVPLIATGTGVRDQGPAIASVKSPVGPSRGLRLLQRVHVDQVATDPIVLTVRPLPEAPPGYSGLVGEFVVDSRMNVTRATVGQSIPWTVTIRGNGALEGYSLPAFEAEQVSIYENETNTAARVNDGAFEARTRFERVVVPTEPGTVQMPAFELITFSTARGEYVTHRAKLPPIEVTPGRDGAGELTSFADPSTGEVTAEAPDSGPVPRGIIRSGSAIVWPAAAWLPWMLALVGLPGLASLGFDGATALRRWLDARAIRPEAERTSRDLLDAAPTTGPSRWVALEAALHKAVSERPPGDEHTATLHDLIARVGRVRFAPGTDDDGLADDIARTIRSLS